MIENVQIESVSVLVSDQEQAKEFYVDTLGFDLLVDYTWREGMLWSEVAPRNSATSLMLVTWSACMLPSMYRVIVLATDDIQAIHEELVAKGIDFELPLTETPRGTRAMFRDPDGNALLLWDHAGAQAEAATRFSGRGRRTATLGAPLPAAQVLRDKLGRLGLIDWSRASLDSA